MQKFAHDVWLSETASETILTASFIGTPLTHSFAAARCNAPIRSELRYWASSRADGLSETSLSWFGTWLKASVEICQMGSMSVELNRINYLSQAQLQGFGLELVVLLQHPDQL